MTMMHSIEPRASAGTKIVEFEAAMTRGELDSFERVCHSFGINRRVVSLLATHDRAEMFEMLTRLSDDDDCLAETLDIVLNYREHIEGMAELARAVEARFLLTCRQILEVSGNAPNPMP